ncbi:asparagine synthase (glutamine-hydrolyzing) [Candidatus Uabimicrobium amorphum]|uniref:asparagine synthase (glutamine-hydrolyzing) n=1 Tax=Uabimicrobium amorphum TaxID=2596890 RepID=A0A5S9F423_UABAM|nr:asparagine synthase (glutamine-hydrolyzing) [Candidatus Uabimicrobium amorphum]BBM85082.1 amidotransferase 1, exosortase Asystem-associated [Candidatus Uabimicrobium amorphum]
MCGISGIFDPTRQHITRQKIQKMNDTLYHRGPDGEGFFVEQCIALGHRRLSIIDVTGGAQPLFNEDKTIAVVCNGEIYNHHNLRSELKQNGHQFHSLSDSEVIVHLYEELGERCLNKLQGMFAFALWDQNKQQLFLARDRLGIKPLVYSIVDKSVFFASEIKALLAAGVDRQICPQAVSTYFSLGYTVAPHTIYTNIHKLLPGHFLLANHERITTQKYWDLPQPSPANYTIDEWKDIVRSSLQRAVDSRLESEVPLGAFLSGGIDSSAVVAAISQKRKIATFTIGFNERAYDESSYAAQVAARYHCNHHAKTISPSSPQDLEEVLHYFDEPFADPSILPTFSVCREAKKHITVVLSGDGGDENFAGYRRYYIDALENNIRHMIPGFMRRSLVPFFARIYPKADWLPRIFRLKTALQNIALPSSTAYFQSLSTISPAIKQQILLPEFCHDAQQQVCQYYNKIHSDDLLSKALYTDIKVYLPDDILTKVDICSMANALEVRVPLLDHFFVEQAFQIPSNYKLNGAEGKYIFKKTLENWLDKDILYRRKMGFCIPMNEWLTNDLHDMFSELVLNGKLPFFNYKNIRHLHQKHLKGLSNQTDTLWSLFIFHLWYFIKGNKL